MEKDYDFVLVEKDKFVNFLRDSLELQALCEGGVDNWEWCGTSINNFIQCFIEDNNIEHDEDIYLDDIAEFLLERDYDIINLNEEFQNAAKEKEEKEK